MASIAVSMVPCPDIMMTGTSEVNSLIRSSTSIPSILGILISQNTTSGFSVFTDTNPSMPFSANTTSCPSKERMSFIELRMLRSSSITSIFAMVIFFTRIAKLGIISKSSNFRIFKCFPSFVARMIVKLFGIRL